MKESSDYAYLNDYWDILETEYDTGKVFSTIDQIIKGAR